MGSFITTNYSFFIKDYVKNEKGEQEIKFKHLCDEEFWSYRSLSSVREKFPEKIDDAYFLNKSIMFKASEKVNIGDVAIKRTIKDDYNEKTVYNVYLSKKDIYNLPSEEKKRIDFENNKENYKTIKEKRNDKLEKYDYMEKVFTKTTNVVVDAAVGSAKVYNVVKNVQDYKPNVEGVQQKNEKETNVANGQNVEEQKIENGLNVEKQKIENGQNAEKVILAEIPKEEKEHNI